MRHIHLAELHPAAFSAWTLHLLGLITPDETMFYRWKKKTWRLEGTGGLEHAGVKLRPPEHGTSHHQIWSSIMGLIVTNSFFFGRGSRSSSGYAAEKLLLFSSSAETKVGKLDTCTEKKKPMEWKAEEAAGARPPHGAPQQQHQQL